MKLTRLAAIALAGVLGVASPSSFILQQGESVSAAVATLTITQQGFTVVGDSAWRVVVDIGGATGGNLNLDVVSHRRVNTRGELADVAEGRVPNDLDRLRFAVDDVPRNAAGRIVLLVPTATNTSTPDDLLFGTTGVYPVSVELRDGETVLGSTLTFIHRLEPDDALSATTEGMLQVMSVAALASAPARTANGESVASPQFAAQLGDLVDAYRDTNAGAFISLQGDQAAVAAADTLATLRADSERHTFAATPFVPMSAGAAAEVGVGELFASQLRAGEDAVAGAIGVTPDRAVMVLDDKLNAAGAVLLRDVGVRGVILTSRALDASGFRGLVDSALTYRAQANDGSTLLVHGIDPVYATNLDDRALSPLARAVMVTAGLVLQRESLLGAGKDIRVLAVALGTADARPADPVVLQQVFRLVGSSPVLKVSVQPRPVTAETTGDVLSLSAGADASLVRIKAIVDDLTPRLTSTISMLRDDDPRRRDWPAMLTTMLSSRTGGTLSTALAKNLRSATKEVLGSLNLPTTANFTLSSRRAELRLQVRNSSDSPMRAVVRFRSAKLKFARSRQVLEVPANASAEVVVAVEARSNGRFPVIVQLLTPRGDLPLGEPVTITANVSAIAGLGQVVTATALLILLTWWAHNWRGRRRRAIEAAVAESSHPSRPVERANPAPNN